MMIKHVTYVFLLILSVLILISGCSKDEPITEVNYAEFDFAPFVEKEFPFITTFLLIDDENGTYPESNISARCLAMILGENSYACFDTDMLRWSAAWTGDFVPLEGVSQVAYPDFLSRNDKMPYLTEKPHFVTGLYPGWSAHAPQFTDPRPPAPHPDEPSWGALPQEYGRWNGVYLTEREPVLSYTVSGTDIFETPGSIESESGTVFTRTFKIEHTGSVLFLTAAEIPDAIQVDAESDKVIVHHRDGNTISVFLLKDAGGIAAFDVIEDRYLTVRVDEADGISEFTLLTWRGEPYDSELPESIIGGQTFSTPDYSKGSSNPWPEPVQTRGNTAQDSSAYVVDELILPIPNPWNRNVRVVDLAFFEDGRAAVVTFDGDVWIADGMDKDLQHISWHRFASGLYETLSIEIVDGLIYTYGKDGIVRLHDLNGNGFADFYENFSNLMAQSIETREWASDIVAKPDGGFYVAKGAALDMGPAALTEAVIRGIRAGSQHSGVVLEISEDGRSAELFASGFRGPYLGIHPETGLLTASDQEGHHVPSTPILAINRGDYYGVSATAHRESIPEITPPLLWIPHNVDRSGISQVWITGSRMGPLSGDLIHFSYGRPGLFRILTDSTSSGMQGGVSVIPSDFPAPTMKGAVNPVDGQLYVAGFTLWGTNSDGMTGLFRLRYTGLPSYIPSGFKVRDGGVILSFDTELDAEFAAAISNYRVERWNYQRTENYGSGHFRLDGTPGQEMLPVFSANLSDDGKSVFLAIPNVEQTEQMQISYKLRATDGTEFSDHFWFTVHYIDELNLIADGFSGIDIENLFADSGSLHDVNRVDEPVSENRGRELFMRTGCIGCHTTDGSEGTGVGPTLKDLYGSERAFQNGTIAIANEEYIRQKLLNPGDRILEGYDEGMPSFLGILSDNDIDSIVEYIKMLSY